MKSRIGILLSLIMLLLVVGCAEESQWDRIPLSGSLTLDGQSVDGSLNFRPTGGIRGPTAAVQVTNGTFQCKKSSGPVSGSHRVTLSPATGARIVLEAELPSDKPYSIQLAFSSPPKEEERPAVVIPAGEDTSAK